MLELFADIKTVLNARKVKRMMIIYLEEQYAKNVKDSQDDVFEICKLSMQTRKRISYEEYVYELTKAKIMRKWEMKLFKKRKY